MTILKALFEQDAARPAAKAGETTITYGRLCADIDAMAHWLLGNGLQPGERITIHTKQAANPDYWDWIMHLGAMRAGLAESTGPMPPAVAKTGVLGPYAAALGHLDALHSMANPRLKLPFAPGGDAPLAEQLRIEPGEIDLDGLESQTVRLLKTSGTTGTPKVIRWDSAMLAKRLEQVRNIGDIHADTRLFTALGMITTTGLRYPLAAWQKGAFVYLASIAEKATDFREIADGSTFVAASPFRMQGLLKLYPGEWADKEQRVIELFGGRVPPALHEETLARCCGTLRMSYGATEVGRVAAGDTAMVERHPGAVGTVEPGVTVEIVDGNGNPLPAGQEGLVRLKSDFMCHEYLGARPGEPSPFRGGWFYPGDIGVLFEDGLFAMVGRQAETINLSGAKLSPVVLEQRIMALPEVQDACVLALNTRKEDVLAVAVVCADDVKLPELRKKMLSRLPRQFPFLMIRVPRIPRNGMGRVPRARFAANLLTLIDKTGKAKGAALQK